jgi:hypothetical protein
MLKLQWKSRPFEVGLSFAQITMLVLKSTTLVHFGWLAVCLPALALVGMVSIAFLVTAFASKESQDEHPRD